MTKAQAIKQLEIWRECMRADLAEPDVIETYNMAIQALEYDDAKYHEEHGEVVIADVVWDDALKAKQAVSHLKDRPCEACEYHSERGCSKWDCVFDEVLRG